MTVTQATINVSPQSPNIAEFEIKHANGQRLVTLITGTTIRYAANGDEIERVEWVRDAFLYLGILTRFLHNETIITAPGLPEFVNNRDYVSHGDADYNYTPELSDVPETDHEFANESWGYN